MLRYDLGGGEGGEGGGGGGVGGGDCGFHSHAKFLIVIECPPPTPRLSPHSVPHHQLE